MVGEQIGSGSTLLDPTHVTMFGPFSYLQHNESRQHSSSLDCHILDCTTGTLRADTQVTYIFESLHMAA